MNPLEQVKTCQIYIIATKLHQDRSIITSKSETSQTGRISELKSENWAKFLYAPHQKTQCATPLWSCFWGTSWSPNWAHDSSLESPTCLLSNPIRFFQFGVHFPLQNCNLPRLVLAGAKRGRKVIFGVFLTFRQPRIWWNSLTIPEHT